MAPPKSHTNKPANKNVMHKGAWTEEEDRRLAEYIETHGAKKWKTIAIKAGLNRCGKSCRLRWLNYLRPNIKRGNISDEEEDLILRLHKLLGNRWALIAGRLPGRTDNEIKNYWNSHLSKKINQHKERSSQNSGSQQEQPSSSKAGDIISQLVEPGGEEFVQESSNSELNFDVDDIFDFSMEGTCGLDWVSTFLELD